MSFSKRRSLMAMIAVFALSATALAQDWPHLGGNPARNGYAPNVVGPTSADLVWSNTDDYSVISWFPYIYDGRVYAIREAGFPQSGGNANDALVAYDLATGDEDWRVTLPFTGDTVNEWIAWIAGINDGKVYAARSANTRFQPIRAYDATTGAALWVSEATTNAFAYDGVIFADDGDLIVGDPTYVTRINAADGTTVWQTERTCSVSGNCGGAAVWGNSALYIDEVAPGGQVITRLDIDTGQKLYSSDVMPGFTTQSSPFVSPDGSTVYFQRSQGSDTYDLMYAFQDTGAEFVELWSVPIAKTEVQGVGPSGVVYALLANNEFVGLSPTTGEVLYSAGELSSITVIMMIAIDADGKVYLTNKWSGSSGQSSMWVFSPDLQTEHFSLVLNRQNQGGPALGGDNMLVIADRTGVYAYQGPTAIDGDVDGDGDVDLADLQLLLSAYGSFSGDPNFIAEADLDDDGDVDLSDLQWLLANYGTVG